MWSDSMELHKSISLLHRKMNIELNTRLSKLNLTAAKCVFIKNLYENGKMTQIDLCKSLELDKSTVAKTLVRMDNKGLIIKQVNPEDSRSFLVSLTSKAIKLYPKIQEIFFTWTNDIISDMDETEKTVFLNLIDKTTKQAVKIVDKT